MPLNALTEIAKLGKRPNVERVGPIGLHCALEEIHLVQMVVDASAVPRLKAAVTMAYPMPRDALFASQSVLRDLVKQALKRDNFSGRGVISSMPQRDTKIFPLNFQVKPGQDEGNAIITAASDRVADDLSAYVMDFLPIRTERRAEDRLGILALAKREKVIAYLEALRKCGLKPLRLEIGPVAIRRLVSSINRSGSYENVVAINFGREASYISVVSGRRLLLDQALNFGEKRLLQDIESALSLETAQIKATVARHGLFPDGVHAEIAATIREIIKPALLELVEEINRTLIYIASQTRGEPVRRIYLLGSLARWSGADRLLNSLIKLDVETIPNPLYYYAQDVHPIAEPRPEIAVATGLALSGIVDNE